MGWFTNSVSVLTGYQSEQTIQTLLNESTLYDATSGVWKVGLHEDVTRPQTKLFLINWMKGKHFQAIVTSPRHICFVQPENDRICFAVIRKDLKLGKGFQLLTIDMSQKKFVNGSSTDAFAKILYSELAIDMAKQNLLSPQLFNGFPLNTLSDVERIIRENILLNIKDHSAYLFLRMGTHVDAFNVTITSLKKQRFTVKEKKESEVQLAMYGDKIGCNVKIGYNAGCHLFLHIQLIELTERSLKNSKLLSTSMHQISVLLAQENVLRSQKFAYLEVAPAEFSREDQLEMIDTKMEDIIPISDLNLKE